MRIILFLLFIFLSIKSIYNTQCAPHPDIIGDCGCCPLIGGSCIYYSTIDGFSVSWHLCVPQDRQKTFSLEECKPKLIIDKNFTRICRTKNETFRLFPQCSKKDLCFLPLPSKKFTPQCTTQMAVKGSCKKALKRYSYDSNRRECVEFIYSGCGGTTNRFIRQDKCQKLCTK